jgi:hypothetical protein
MTRALVKVSANTLQSSRFIEFGEAWLHFCSKSFAALRLQD